MKVFITGATGFVGSAVVQEFIHAGNQVLGLARSSAAAHKLIAAGAEVHQGDLEDLESLKRGAAAADGIVHCGFIHDFSRYSEVCEVDRRAVEAIGEALAGTNKPFLVTSGTALVNPGTLATEEMIPSINPAVPRVSEQAADALAAGGVKAAVIRLSPSVHGPDDHGFIHMLFNIAREKGVSAYIGAGLNRWSAVHRLDAAGLYRLALENAAASARFHAVAEEEVAFKSIAQAIGQQLNVPVRSIPTQQAEEHFGWFAHFAAMDVPTSSRSTRARLNWQPKQQTLLEDIEAGLYTNL